MLFDESKNRENVLKIFDLTIRKIESVTMNYEFQPLSKNKMAYDVPEFFFTDICKRCRKYCTFIEFNTASFTANSSTRIPRPENRSK